MTGEVSGGSFSVTGLRIDRAVVGYCRDCRWWSTVETTYRDGWGICEMAESEGQKDKFGPNYQQTLAFAVDGEMIIAGLETAPTFGCVQFQPQPSPPIEDGTNITTDRTVTQGGK